MLIGICGKKQAGKNSLANYYVGKKLEEIGEVPSSYVNNEGKLVITVKEPESDDLQEAVLDLENRNPEFVQWASDTLWPKVRTYAFANNLKDMSIALFGLTHEQCYGTDLNKNEKVPHLLWENMPGKKGPKKGEMTAREFLQFMGTEVCRKIHGPCWIDSCLNQVKMENSDMALITDCRFINEVEAIQAAGGKVIRLTRSLSDKDLHASEVECDSYDKFDAIIDNKDMTMEESQAAFDAVLKEWGVE